MSETVEAKQSAWCVDVLGILPPARNRGPVRTELKTRRAMIGERLQGIVNGADPAVQAGIRGVLNQKLATADQLMGGLGLEDDSTAAGEFVKATRKADEVLGDLLQYVAELQKLAAEAEAEAKRRRDIRDKLEQDFKERLARQGELQASALKYASPGSEDTDIRQPQDAVRQALAAPGLRISVGPGFDDAAKQVDSALKGMQAAEDRLKARADGVLAKTPALEALDGATGRARGMAGHAVFGPAAATVAQDLVAARNTLLAADAAQGSKDGQAAADAAGRKLDAIAAAAQAHDALAGSVTAAAGAAQETAGAALRRSWADAAAAALLAVATGEDGAKLLNEVAPKVTAVTELTLRAEALQKRGGTLLSDLAAAEGRLGADQRKAVGDVAALATSISDIPTSEACGKLETAVGDAEAALKGAVEAVDAYDELRGRLAADGDGLPVATNAKVDGPALFRAALEAADTARATDHGKGADALAGLDANLVPFRDLCAALLKLDAGLGVKQVAEKLRGPLGTLQNGIKAGLGVKGKLGGLDKTVEQVSVGTAGWQAYYETVPGINMDPTKGAGKKATDQVRGWISSRDEFVARAEKAAGNGNAELVRDELGRLKEWLHNLGLYLTAGTSVLEKAAALEGKLGPVSQMIDTLAKEAGTAVTKKQFAAAGSRISSLQGALDPAQALFKAYKEAKEALAGTAGIGSKAMAAANATQDKELADRLTAQVTGLKPIPGELGARTDELVKLLADARQALADRHDQVRGDVAAAVGGDKAQAAFADKEAAVQAGKLYAQLGPDGLASLLTQVGDGSGGPEAVTRMVKGIGVLAPEQVTTLVKELGGPGMLGRLCGADGSTTLPHTLAIEFEKVPQDLGQLVKGVGSDAERFLGVTGGDASKAKAISEKFKPADLRSLLRDGFGDDPDTIEAVFKAGGYDGSKVKALSGAFINDRPKLATLIADLGGGADAVTLMKKLADKNLGGDWAKLKTPFYDEIDGVAAGNAAVRTKLISNAQYFQSETPNPAALPAADLHGFADVKLKHVYERHVSENFDFKPSNIKEKNNQFERKDIADVPAICGAAVKEVRGLLDWQANPAGLPRPPGAVEKPPTGGVFRKFNVTLPPPHAGMRLQVGYDTTTNTVDQIFPRDGVPISQDEMEALKKAMQKSANT